MLRDERGGGQEPQGGARGAARGAEHVYVTGCAARLGREAFEDAGERRKVVRENAEEAAERIGRELGAAG